MNQRSPKSVALIVISLLPLAVLGCGSGADPNQAVAAANATNLQRLANLYTAYQSQHGWLGPKNDADFKSFISTLDADRLQRINVDPNTVDALFTSERDGQPFKIRYAVRGNILGSAEPVIFESAGVDGKFQVGQLDMIQREVDQAERDALFAGKGPAPAPAQR